MTSACATCSFFRHNLKEAEAKIGRLLEKNQCQDEFFDDMTKANVELYDAAKRRRPEKQRDAGIGNNQNTLESQSKSSSPAAHPSETNEIQDAFKNAFERLQKVKTSCKTCCILRQNLIEAEKKIARLLVKNRCQDDLIDHVMKSNIKLWEASNEAPKQGREAERFGNITTSESEDEDAVEAENENMPPVDPPSPPNEARDALNRALDELETPLRDSDPEP